MKKIKVAFIGAGPTTQAHIQAFKDIAEVELCGIYNRTIEKAQVLAQEFGIHYCADSIDALYQISKPDLVVVCVYEPAKREIMLKCIPHQIPILAEKPIGLDYNEAVEIHALAKQHQCPLWVALNRRCYASTREALGLLNEHHQERRMIEVCDQQDLNLARKLGHSEHVLQHWMYANSIHLMDYFTTFARGTLEKITILSPWHPASPGFVAAHLLFNSGDMGLYKAYWNGPGPWSCTVATQSLFLELKPLEQLRYQMAGSRAWHTPEPSDVDKQFKPGFRLQAQQAVYACLQKQHHLADINSALISTQFVHDIYSAS